MSLVSPLVAVAAALVIAGCGSGGSGATAAPATGNMPTAAQGSTAQDQVLKLSADPGGQLRFNTSTLTAPKPGKVTLRMTNPSSAGMDHSIAIEGNGVDREGPMVGPGKVSTLTVALKKGSYTYYCSVPGHREAGMTGTLTVK